MKKYIDLIQGYVALDEYIKGEFPSIRSLLTTPDFQHYKLNNPDKGIELIEGSKGSNVSSKAGTAVHKDFEIYVNSLKDDNYLTEERLSCSINGLPYSGLADLIIKDNNTFTIGDLKCKGGYSLVMFLKGDTENERRQLSAYSYAYSEMTKMPMPTKGYILLYGLGISASSSIKPEDFKVNFWELEGRTPQDFQGAPLKTKKGFKGTKAPELVVVELDLMTVEEIQTMTLHKVNHKNIDSSSALLPRGDCEEWRCGYCNAKCVFNLNIKKDK